jgi:hypothetical protein
MKKVIANHYEGDQYQQEPNTRGIFSPGKQQPTHKTKDKKSDE